MIHPALNDIASNQSKPTEQTKIATNMSMDYLPTNSSARLGFHSSDMQLHADTDAAYSVSPKSKSRAAGYFYLSQKSSSLSTTISPSLNALMHIECILLKHVVFLATEAEAGALFHNFKTAIGLKIFRSFRTQTTTNLNQN